VQHNSCTLPLQLLELLNTFIVTQYGLLLSSETTDSEGPNPSGKVQSVDEFVPEVGLDRTFLEDGGTAVKSKKKPPTSAPILDSDR